MPVRCRVVVQTATRARRVVAQLRRPRPPDVAADVDAPRRDMRLRASRCSLAIVSMSQRPWRSATARRARCADRDVIAGPAVRYCHVGCHHVLLAGNERNPAYGPGGCGHSLIRLRLPNICNSEWQNPRRHLPAWLRWRSRITSAPCVNHVRCGQVGGSQGDCDCRTIVAMGGPGLAARIAISGVRCANELCHLPRTRAH